MVDSDNKAPVVLEKLCMCISYIALSSFTSFWPNCVNEIIGFGKIDYQTLYLSLLILKHMVLICKSHFFDIKTNSQVSL